MPEADGKVLYISGDNSRGKDLLRSLFPVNKIGVSKCYALKQLGLRFLDVAFVSMARLPKQPVAQASGALPVSF